MPEMPIWAYAVASDHPNALFSEFFSPSVALTVLPYMSAPPPKSNGMIVKLSMFAPSAAAWVMSRLPHQVGPVVLVPNVMIVLMPGLFCLTIFNAPRIRSCTTAFSNSSLFSMSMSMYFRLYALITCWYAPARACALVQFGPSLLPLQPPNEICTSPPADRIALITFWSTPPSSGRLLSHAGEQPPPESMNAMVNCLMPVADMTVPGLGGSPQPL